ncbi:hypothetical protein ACNIRQ_26455, partial [Escherichia coli]
LSEKPFTGELRIFMEGDHPITPSGSGNNRPDCDRFRCHLAAKEPSAINVMYNPAYLLLPESKKPRSL